MQIYNTYWYISTYTSHESRSSTTAVDPVKLIWFDLIWPQARQSCISLQKGSCQCQGQKNLYVQALCIVVLEVLTLALFLHFAGADKKVEGQKEGASDTSWEKLCLHYLQQVHWKELPAGTAYKLYKLYKDCFCKKIKRRQLGAQSGQSCSRRRARTCSKQSVSAWMSLSNLDDFAY